MSFVLVVILSFATLAIPLAAIAWLWRGKYTSRTDWLLRVLAATSAVVFSLLAGTWVFLSIYLKYAFKLLFVAAAIKTFPRLEDRKIFGRRDSKGRVRYTRRLVILAVFLALDLLVLKGGRYSGEPLELAFPLRDGKYLALQGGGGSMTNPFHSSDPSQRYAIDLVKLNVLGNRANGFLPGSLPRYKIYGEVLYSPCSGRVIEAVDGLPDNDPREADAHNPAGNHVVMECGRARVLLAHLMSGSLAVKPGQFVKENQLLGRVGNSGNTLEPHLHIQAFDKEKTDKAIPLTFNGEFLTLNSTFRN